MLTLLNAVRRLDRSRPGVPGEHWITFAIGLRYILRSNDGMLGAVGSKALGLALIARALSGRDGAIAMLRRPSPVYAGRNQPVDIAAAWPYHQRVRVFAESSDEPRP